MKVFLWRCEGTGCHVALQLLARTVKGLLCPSCWRTAGYPALVTKEAYAQEIATRERMLARGGTDRHLVRKGLT